MSDQGSYFDIQSPDKEPKGALVGTIIVIILLIVGAIYVLSTKNNSMTDLSAPANDSAISSSTDENLGTSTDLNDIEKDLKTATDSAVDAELNNLDKELGV